MNLAAWRQRCRGCVQTRVEPGVLLFTLFVLFVCSLEHVSSFWCWCCPGGHAAAAAAADCCRFFQSCRVHRLLHLWASRSLALGYWSGNRTISRIESDRMTITICYDATNRWFYSGWWSVHIKLIFGFPRYFFLPSFFLISDKSKNKKGIRDKATLNNAVSLYLFVGGMFAQDYCSDDIRLEGRVDQGEKKNDVSEELALTEDSWPELQGHW